MKILKLILFIFLFGIFNIVIAIDAPNNIKLENSGEDFLEISWDKIDNAGVYSISYGEKSISGTTDSYEHSEEIVVEKNFGKIEKLNSDTKYYLAVKAYDDEENFSKFSNEVSFSTKGNLEELKIEGVNVIDSRNISLNFNIDIKKESLIDLSITNLNNQENTLSVEKYGIEGKTISIFFDEDLIKLNKYSIVVLAAEGKNGELIKQGVNGSIEFDVPENIKKYSEEKEEDLNSAGTEKPEEKKKEEIKLVKTKVLGGKILDTTKQTTEKTAKEIEKMPKTGPAETALFLIFAFIASGLFFILRRKINN